jgi:hypothetical protein
MQCALVHRPLVAQVSGEIEQTVARRIITRPVAAEARIVAAPLVAWSERYLTQILLWISRISWEHAARKYDFYLKFDARYPNLEWSDIDLNHACPLVPLSHGPV